MGRFGIELNGSVVLRKTEGARLTNEQLTVGRGPKGIRPQSDELGETTLNERASALDQGVHKALTSGATCSSNHASFWPQGRKVINAEFKLYKRVLQTSKSRTGKTPS